MKKIKPILCIILPLFSLSLFSCNQEKEDINNTSKKNKEFKLSIF